MTDLITPLKDAVVGRMKGHVGATVFDHVPDGHPPPVVILDQIDRQDAGGKDSGLLRVTLTVQVIAQGRSRDVFRAIMAAVQNRLTRWRPPATGQVLFGEISFLSAGEQMLGDGITHMGNVQFQVFVQPA